MAVDRADQADVLLLLDDASDSDIFICSKWLFSAASSELPVDASDPVSACLIFPSLAWPSPAPAAAIQPTAAVAVGWIDFKFGKLGPRRIAEKSCYFAEPQTGPQSHSHGTLGGIVGEAATSQPQRVWDFFLALG